MTQIILIIIGVAIIAILLSRRARETTIGICAAALGQDAKKRENKEKILALLAERGSLSNADIREVLKISERTAVRYMDELEREGKVEQIGNTGRSVTYRVKT